MMSDISILGLLKGDSLLSMENGLVLFSFFLLIKWFLKMKNDEYSFYEILSVLIKKCRFDECDYVTTFC